MSIKINYLLLIIALCLLGWVGNAQAQEASAETTAVPSEWVNTYTPEELAAIDHALWAVNMTRDDLDFRKDYTEGYECFPIVRHWLAHPLNIAPDMDGMVSGIGSYKDGSPSPFAEFYLALDYYETPVNFYCGLVSRGSDWPYIPGSIEDLENYLNDLINMVFVHPWDDHELEILRQYVPVTMSWHDVFTSPFPEETVAALEAEMEDMPGEFTYELMSRAKISDMAMRYSMSCPDPRGWLTDLPMDFWPVMRPLIIETENGRIGIGTIMDDEWEGDFRILIEPGGDDHYLNCRIGASYGYDGDNYGYFVDLGGNDYYDCADIDITFGAAILGVAAFYDLGQGNDRYFAGNCSLGAAMCGIATFYDDGGSDTYSSKVYSQGAAGFGIGIMCDESVQAAPVMTTDEGTPDPVTITEFDNDLYHAWANSQAFARTLGFAICSNQRGNDIYEAGGVYLDAPLFADRYQSFSQGFAIGERDIDYAGGIALILDYDGNDRYLGDIYNQGVGYWYSAGLLYDVAGNDTYEMTQYGQGSGIHLAVGGLIDVAGGDSYTMHTGLGTGGSHDYAASVLHDRGGNDQYFGNSSCNGGSLTNSAVIFIDRAGDDTYAARRDGGINFGRPERGFPSIGILIDLGGTDDYLGIMDNGMLWSHTDIGVGWDIVPPPVPEEEVVAVPERGQLGENVTLPEVISYEGEITQEVFDELWEISVRWEVGDNRFIVPRARERIIAFGPEVLPYVSQKFDNMNSGLAIGSFDAVLKAFLETNREDVMLVLSENLANDEQMRRRIALAEIATLKITEMEGQVAEILDDPDPAFQRRAIGVIGALESHVADERLIANLAVLDDEALVKISMETLFLLKVECWAQLRPLLNYPYISVREALVGLLAINPDLYGDDIVRELVDYVTPPDSDETPIPLDIRSLRSLIRIFQKTEMVPDDEIAGAISSLLEHEDWGVRADGILVVRHWQEMSIPPEPVEIAEGTEPAVEETPVEEVVEIDYDALSELVEPLLAKIALMMKTEIEPYVLFVGTMEE